MTKLALGLALAGIFTIGFLTGLCRHPQRAETEERLGIKLASQPVELQPVNLVRDEKLPRLESQLILPSSETPAIAGNAEFSKLMKQCREVERSWRKRTMSPMVTARWEASDPEYIEAGAARAEKNFALAINKSAVWRATAQLPFGSESFELQSTVRFHSPQPYDEFPQTCWNMETYFRKDSLKDAKEGWMPLGVQGGCRSMDLDSRAEPVVTHATYDQDDLGAHVSVLIIPLDVLSHGSLKYLPTEGEGGWREASFDFIPFSDEEFVRERLANGFVSNGNRAPANVEK